MTDKHVVITGGNVGIGFATAKLFKSKGYKVTIVGRSKDKLEAAQKHLENVDIGICDLSVIKSIDEYVKSTAPIDVLVNNAGVWLSEFKKSELDQELTFATNHLGTMYLTLELMKHNKLTNNASIVVVSSDLHKKGVLDLEYFDKLNATNFNGMNSYSQSKLYNLLFALYLVNKYLPQHYADKHFKVTSVHPGFIPTTELKRQTNFFISTLMDYVLPLMPFTTTVEDAANRILTAVEDSESNGKYVGNKGYEETTELAKNEEYATELWKKSVSLLKL